MSKHTFKEDDTPQVNFRKKQYYFFARKAVVLIPDEPGENTSLLKKNETELILYSRDSSRHSDLTTTLANYVESCRLDTKQNELPFDYKINDKELTVRLTGSFLSFIENLSISNSMSKTLAGEIKGVLSPSESYEPTNGLYKFS